MIIILLLNVLYSLKIVFLTVAVAVALQHPVSVQPTLKTYLFPPVFLGPNQLSIFVYEDRYDHGSSTHAHVKLISQIMGSIYVSITYAIVLCKSMYVTIMTCQAQAVTKGSYTRIRALRVFND